MEIEQVKEIIEGQFKQLRNEFGELEERIECVELDSVGDSRRPMHDGVASNSPDSEKQLAATANYLRTGEVDRLEKREISITGPDGSGVMVVPTLSQTIDRLLKDLNPIRANATVVDVPSNSYEKLVSVGGTQALRKKERDARGVTNTGTLSKVTINLYEMSALPSITNEMLSSTNFDVVGWLNQEVADAIATTENDEFINGTGATDGEAQGILTYPTATTADGVRAFGTLQEVVSGTDGDFDTDNLITVIYALGQAYRANAKWYMSTSAIELARKLKDLQGNYMWNDSIAVGQPPTLAGYPVVEVAGLPAVATDSTPVIFGDMSKAYHIADNQRHRTMIVDRITQPGWTKVFTAMMSGGGLVDSNALKLLTLSA